MIIAFFCNFSECGFDQLQGGVNQQGIDQKTSGYLQSSCLRLVGLAGIKPLFPSRSIAPSSNPLSSLPTTFIALAYLQ